MKMSKLICIKCGKVRTLGKTGEESAIKKYGSIDKANTKYLCRGCKKENGSETATVSE